MNRAALLLPLVLAACSKASDQSSTASLDSGERQQLERSIDETNVAVRLKAAEARIVELEKQVGALEATPEKIDLQLLTQRLEQVEAKVYARAPDEGDAPAARTPESTPGPAASPPPAPNRFNPFGL